MPSRKTGTGVEFPPAQPRENTAMVSAEIRCLYPLFQLNHFSCGLLGSALTKGSLVLLTASARPYLKDAI